MSLLFLLSSLSAKSATCRAAPVECVCYTNGFQAWWKLNPKVAEHERSKERQLAFDKWKELAMRSNKNQTLNKSLQEQVVTKEKKWVDILHRVIDVILFLAKQSLPFRGHGLWMENKIQKTFLS